MPVSDSPITLPIASSRLPRPGDPARAALGLERWRDRARDGADSDLAKFSLALAESGAGRALLESIFGNSPFLTNCLLSDGDVLRAVLAQGPQPVLEDLQRFVNATAVAEKDTGRLMQALRQVRRRIALTVALADIMETWPLEGVTRALSDFADTAVNAAARHLLQRGIDAGDLAPADPEDPLRRSGLVILGMGKLGARELNYSSDIDLILLYDPEIVRYTGKRTIQDFFVRLARDLLRILQERTDAGYVFRTDLRLRPDPASTPLAISVLAAETYYEGMGQNWERAAMIKARAIAGDIEAGKTFLKRLRPFVWRKHLDFAAIQDIHSIKRQIHAVKGHRDIAVAGHNIKLGRGGIREIEFFAQTQQLIWGGRNPELRQSGTCAAIEALVAAGRVEPETAAEMTGAYRFLRVIEHRLQMIEDRQTQTLPAAPAELESFGCFAGFESAAAFGETLRRHLGHVEDHYAELFEEAPSLGGPGNLVFTGTDNDPETVKTLGRMGFSDGASVSTVIRGWHHGRYRAMRSTRARELLTEIMPRLLDVLCKTVNPDLAFARFDEFLGRLPAGVQLFSMLYANPGLLDLLAEIMGSAPRLAEHLSRNAGLLDAVLVKGFFDLLPDRKQLRDDLRLQLGQANDFQDVLDIVRRWTKDRQFQVGVRILRGMMGADAAGEPLAHIADAAIAELQPHVEADFARNHGRLPGAGLVTVGLGKLGSGELSFTSDIDLIFIYDLPEGADSDEAQHHLLSDGRKPLAPMHYYARLAQRLINAITAQTGEGALYEVDMRLRPSGNQGPIASTLGGFLRYQTESAWTWEHMALTRARAIAGAPQFKARVESSIREIVCRQRDPARVAADVADMRARIAQQFPGDRLWDLKYRPGGLMDIEFIAQFLQLRHGAAHPELAAPATLETLHCATAAGILPRQTGDDLQSTLRLWHKLVGYLRLTVGSTTPVETWPDSVRRSLVAAGGAVDFAALEQNISDIAARTRQHFIEIVGAPVQREAQAVK
jgi:[glutamine synthetase] adenylyltransferase / [glutamine synthetase]-adenylyl-L-tyrosine phosphorylase